MTLKEQIEQYVGKLLSETYPRKKEVVAYIEKSAIDQVAKIQRKFIEDLDEGQVFDACRALQVEEKPRRPYTRRTPAPKPNSNGTGASQAETNGDS
jgi:hypothetical protein